MIGVWNSLTDIWLGLTNWMWVGPKKARVQRVRTDVAQVDWQTALYQSYPAAGEDTTARRRRRGAPTRVAIEQASESGDETPVVTRGQR